MTTSQLMRASILSAIMVMMSFFFMSTGLGYGLYLEGIVPVVTVMICLICGFKLALLATFNTLLITLFALGDLIGCIRMSQGILIGLGCGLIISRKSGLVDDLLDASLIGAVIMLVIDRYFAAFLGVSLLEEMPIFFGEELLTENMKSIIFYLAIASVPIVTTLLVYCGSLYIGERLKVLKGEAKNKYDQLRHMKSIRHLIFCSSKQITKGIICLLLLLVLRPIMTTTYLKAFNQIAVMILLYFLLMDMFNILVQYSYEKRCSILISRFVSLLILFGFISVFKLTACLVMSIGVWVDKRHHIRSKRSMALNSMMTRLHHV